MRTFLRDYSGWVLYATLAFVFLMIGLLVKQRRDTASILALYTESRAKIQASREAESRNSGKVFAPRGAALAPKALKSPQQDPNELLKIRLNQHSQKTLKDFANQVRLQVQFPQDLQYLPYEMDDDMPGMHGYSGTSNTNLIALAYPKDASPEQALSFLKSQLSSLPGTKGLVFRSLSKGEALPETASGSGLRKGTVWSGTLSNGQELHAIQLRRSDGKGTYMFIYSGPPEYFRGNDGAFDHVYDTARALPRK